MTPAVVEAGLILVLALHLAWSGLIAGSTTVAVAVDALGDSPLRATAAAILRLARPGLLAVAWMEVTAAAVLVGARALHPAIPETGAYWAAVLLPLVAGLVLVSLYGSLLGGDRMPALRLAVGLGGIGMMLGSALLLCSGSGLLLQPEAWPTSEPAFRLLLTWSGTGRFAEFTCLSLAATGGAIMTLGGGNEAGVDAGFAVRFGRRLAIVSIVAWPLALLFTHLNLPAIALSKGGWAIAAAGLVVAGVACGVLTGPLGSQGFARARAPFAVALLLFGLLASSDHLARANALDEVTLAGIVPAAAPATPIEAAAAPSAKLAAGKAVFDRVCHLCHRFDKKLVGPPLDLVVPKYRQDPAALKAFIRNPVKKDPKFPAMPKPAINEVELDAVAAYVLDQAKP
jgi:mono/diheme cytochrome c family protein